jgi:hypothetical protein
MNKQIKDCDTCKHEWKDFMHEEPCMSCIDTENVNGAPAYWVKKEVKDE